MFVCIFWFGVDYLCVLLVDVVVDELVVCELVGDV